MSSDKDSSNNSGIKVPDAFARNLSPIQQKQHGYYMTRQLEGFEERKREHTAIIERQKAAGIRISESKGKSKKGNCCYCQRCNKRVKMHKANPQYGYLVTIPLIASPLDQNLWVCDNCWNKDYDYISSKN